MDQRASYGVGQKFAQLNKARDEEEGQSITGERGRGVRETRVLSPARPFRDRGVIYLGGAFVVKYNISEEVAS